VHFYASTAELVDRVAEYLAEGLTLGEVAVAAATPPHWRAIAARLEAAGIDVAAATAADSLVVLDALRLSSDLLVDGAPDKDRFDRLVGQRVRDAAARGGGVRAFGEIVAVLWHAGDVAAVMALEALWNGLRREVAFTLLCGYPASSWTAGSAECAEVCALHSEVLGEPGAGVVPLATAALRDADASASFPAAPWAPRAARRFVARAMRELGCAALVDDAAIVVSELTTNAVTHAGSPFTVAVTTHGSGVRISVHDRSCEPIVPRKATKLDTSGRGLRLVAALAGCWGSEVLPDGKIVWADLAG
jgi:anti-sigma regulatory factor (Ser/Thr protein kinase)